MAKKKATKRKSTKRETASLKKSVKSHGFILPHGYETRVIVVKKKKKK